MPVLPNTRLGRDRLACIDRKQDSSLYIPFGREISICGVKAAIQMLETALLDPIRLHGGLFLVTSPVGALREIRVYQLGALGQLPFLQEPH